MGDGCSAQRETVMRQESEKAKFGKRLWSDWRQHSRCRTGLFGSRSCVSQTGQFEAKCGMNREIPRPVAYLAEAKKCEEAACHATRTDIVAAYRALATQWRTLARQAGEMAAK